MGGADHVGPQDHLVEGLTGPDPHADRTVLGDRGLGPAARRRDDPAHLAPGAGQEDLRLGPAGGPQVDRRGRARDIDLLHLEAGGDGRDGLGDAGGAHDAHDAGAVRPRRPPRSAAASGRGAPCPPGTAGPARRGRARRPAGGRPRTPETTAWPRTHRRWPAVSPARHRAHTTTHRSRGRRARPTRSAGSTAQSPGGSSSGGRASAVVRRPCTLPTARRASVRVSATAHPPAPSGTATRASSGAVSSAKPPRPAATCGPTSCGAAALDRRPASGGHQVPLGRIAGPGGDVLPGLDDRLPAGAAAEVGGQGPVEQGASRPGPTRPPWPGGH